MPTATTNKRHARTTREDAVPPAPAAPKQDTADKEAAAKKEAERLAIEEWNALVERATEGDSPAARQIKRAIQLERQISTVRKSVNDNRDYLRLMDRNDELTDDQAEFVDVFYPEKERGERRSAEEVEATARARKVARDGSDD